LANPYPQFRVVVLLNVTDAAASLTALEVESAGSLPAVSRNCGKPWPVVHSSVKRGIRQMDKDRIAGGVKKVTGAIKEGIGRTMGDKKIEAEGKRKKAEGRVQNAVGHVKNAMREIINKG
jgi:uncharacterized protein YjbJ (UPF0337 family)